MDQGAEDDALGHGLTRREQGQLRNSLRPRAAVVHEVIREEGEEELRRPSSALMWSGVAAGLSMGFSLIAEGLLRAGMPDAPWRPLVESFGYTVGFVIVVLGRQQLFTENTITSVLPLLSRRSRACLISVARIWSIVLLANLIGAMAFAAVLIAANMFEGAEHAAMITVAEEAAEGSPLRLFVKAIFAGWLIALMVWLLPAAGSVRPLIIILITYIVALGGFAHIIAGSVEVFYLVFIGQMGPTAYLLDFFLPVLLGNIVGGTALVAILNHAQVRDEVGASEPSQPPKPAAAAH